MATFEISRPRLEPQAGPFTVAVLAGGESAERAISLQSGAAVVRALMERGHQVRPIDPADVDLDSYDWAGVDIAFLALHGKFGEDGRVQAQLERLGVPYTGSDAAASRIGISKSASKERFFQHGVATPPYVLIHESDTADRILAEARSLGFPLVVKPDTQGSSLGVSFVNSPDDLPQALARCFSYDSFGILESKILGTEWTVGLLDDLVLPLIQIVPAPERPFFDYEAKYHDDGTGYRFEFEVPTNVVRAIEQLGRNAGRSLGCRGVARVDVMLDRFQRPWVLEVNTIPGLTDHSLVPKMAERLGWSFGELCDRAIRTALHAEVGTRT